MKDYDNDKTPLDEFDDECHKIGDGMVIQKQSDIMTDINIMYMINVSEQV
jgi:hypothetical protein